MNYITADYAKNPSLFVPAWAGQWAPPAWLLDFNEKARLMRTHGVRLMSFAHRADDNIFYPENSLEAVLSCIAMGVDVLELDVDMTKDKVLVLSHDNTLTRCTNVAQMRAENPGVFPESDRFSQWTYEQVAQLRLLDGKGKPTTCLVPRFEDVLKVCSGKIIKMLDKLEEVAADDGKTEDAWREAYLYPLMEKYDSKPSCCTGWHFALHDFWILGSYSKEATAHWKELIASGKTGHCCMEGGIFIPSLDHLDTWKELEQIGVDCIMTNHPMELVRYIAEKYAPCP